MRWWALFGVILSLIGLTPSLPNGWHSWRYSKFHRRSSSAPSCRSSSYREFQPSPKSNAPWYSHILALTWGNVNSGITKVENKHLETYLRHALHYSVIPSCIVAVMQIQKLLEHPHRHRIIVHIVVVQIPEQLNPIQIIGDIFGIIRVLLIAWKKI